MIMSQYNQPRLPLGALVQYAGLECRITGRKFGKEAYDLETFADGHRHIFMNIELPEITVDFARMVKQ